MTNSNIPSDQNNDLLLQLIAATNKLGGGPLTSNAVTTTPPSDSLAVVTTPQGQQLDSEGRLIIQSDDVEVLVAPVLTDMIGADESFSAHDVTVRVRQEDAKRAAAQHDLERCIPHSMVRRAVQELMRAYVGAGQYRTVKGRYTLYVPAQMANGLDAIGAITVD